MEKIDLSQLTAEQLEAALSEKRKQEKENKLAAKTSYEYDRDKLIQHLVSRAKILNDQMRDFKQYAIEQLENFREHANQYGDIRSNSKGGFSLRHRTTGELVSFDRNSIPEYDERAASAETLIKEFLEDKIKKRDLATYRTIAALLERNKAGDMTPSRIASLLKVKDNYDDPRWIKAMELFEESFRIREISYSVSFFRKNTLQKDVPIVLTFASIPVNGRAKVKE